MLLPRSAIKHLLSLFLFYTILVAIVAVTHIKHSPIAILLSSSKNNLMINIKFPHNGLIFYVQC